MAFEILYQPEYQMMLKVIFAAAIGGLIGVERKGGEKGAGSRTFSFICMGSCLFTVLSLHGFGAENNAIRMVAQIITGVGFLGAGVIWKSACWNPP